MYAKTMPQAGRLTTRQKRIFGIAAVLVVVLFGGLAAWGVTAHDAYGTSAHGCVSVTVPNSTGGAVLHHCGSQAQAFCQASFRSTDQVLPARPAAVQAGWPGPGRLLGDLTGDLLGDLTGDLLGDLLGGPEHRRVLAGRPGHRSTMMVTGPSLTRDTFMSAPKTPVSTWAPRSRRACTTAVTRGSATGPGAAADQDGRRPLARSA